MEKELVGNFIVKIIIRMVKELKNGQMENLTVVNLLMV